LYVWISGLPKTKFYTLAPLLLPVIALVDGIGHLCGQMKVGNKDTWDDELVRTAHNARRIEIAVGLMNISYLGCSVLSFFAGISIFAPTFVSPWVPVILSPFLATYTRFVFEWSIKHGIDPVNGTRLLVSKV